MGDCYDHNCGLRFKIHNIKREAANDNASGTCGPRSTVGGKGANPLYRALNVE